LAQVEGCLLLLGSFGSATNRLFLLLAHTGRFYRIL
jgi:hypothetical protein